MQTSFLSGSGLSKPKKTRSSDPTEPPPTTLLEPRLHCILTLPRVLSIGKMFSLSPKVWLARPSCHESVPEPDPVARDCSTPQSQARIQLKAELPRAHDSDAAAIPAFSASTSESGHSSIRLNRAMAPVPSLGRSVSNTRAAGTERCADAGRGGAESDAQSISVRLKSALRRTRRHKTSISSLKAKTLK